MSQAPIRTTQVTSEPIDVTAHRITSADKTATIDVLLVAGNDNPCGERSAHVALERLVRLMARAYVATLVSEARA